MKNESNFYTKIFNKVTEFVLFSHERKINILFMNYFLMY